MCINMVAGGKMIPLWCAIELGTKRRMADRYCTITGRDGYFGRRRGKRTKRIAIRGKQS